MYGLTRIAQLPGIDLDSLVAAEAGHRRQTASLSARDIKRFKRNGGSLGALLLLAIDTSPAARPDRDRPWPGSARSSVAPATTTRTKTRTYTARPVIETGYLHGPPPDAASK